MTHGRYNISASLDTNLESTPSSFKGIFTLDNNHPLDNVYIRMIGYKPVKSMVELYASSIPSRIDCLNVEIKEKIEIEYSGTAGFHGLYACVGKYIEGVWYRAQALIINMPREISLLVEPNRSYDMDSSPGMASLPNIRVNAVARCCFDVYIQAEGRVQGMRGDYRLFVEGVKSSVSAILEGDRYRIRSMGIGRLYINARDLPVMENYRINQIEVFARNIQSMDLRITMASGIYPVIYLENCKGGEI